MNFFDFIYNKKNVLIIISIFINIILVISISYIFITKDEEVESNNILSLNNEVKDDNKDFYVEIKGEVKNKGVYLVNDKMIINDLIKLAGGLSKNAYTNNINLSKKLKEEEVIYIYSKNEYKKKNTIVKNIYVDKPCECSTYEISNCKDNYQSEIISSDKDTSYSVNENNEISNGLININNASKEELLSLSGIGESKANAIIKYREDNGYFKSIDEIMNVSGIGNALFEQIKDKITI